MISFANASAYSPRECYSGVAEFSVYTAGEARGRGAAHPGDEGPDLRRGEGRLLEAYVSRVFVENEPSRKLLLSLGFREVGNPREARQARRGMARRCGRRAAHPGQPVGRFAKPLPRDMLSLGEPVTAGTTNGGGVE